MPQISTPEFAALPLRVHAFLADVPLHDSWVVELPKPRSGITLEAFRQASGGRLLTPSPIVRTLLTFRVWIGSVFGWDGEREQKAAKTNAPTFADRLSPADRAASLAPAGTSDGAFHVVYRLANEGLDEILNATVHAGMLFALVENANSYRFYLAVYVRNVNRLTPFYMALIDPVRKVIVYPSLLRSVRATWEKAF